MKIRFTRIISILCAAMLMVSAAAVWAYAEENAATPTDLSPVNGETVPEEPDEVPEESEPAQEQAQEQETEDEPVSSVELIIAQALSINQSWEGRISKTKPAVLKLAIEQPQPVCLLIEGEHVWATMEKEDEVTEDAQKYQTDSETNQTVILANAEAANYLITLGPVEPNILAIAKVTIMDKAAYEAWETENISDEAEPEENLNDSEPDEQAEPVEKPEDNHEMQEEQEPEMPADDVLLSLGYYKVQVSKEEGTDLFEMTDPETEPAAHLEHGTELWVKTTEKEEWAELYRTDEQEPACYIKWEDLIITLKPEAEEEEEEEPLPARYIEITSTLTDYKYISNGMDITMTAQLYNFRDNDVCEFQWQYYDEVTGQFIDIEGANEQTYTYQFSLENMLYNWKLVVTIQNGEE